MTALAKEKAGSVRKVTRDRRPISANVKAYKGALAACDSDGFYCPATGATTEVVVGRFAETVDNTGGADGAKSVDVHFFRERVLFLLANDSGTAVVAADRERECYVLDDQTVTGDDTKGVAGIAYDVTSEGVWVEIGNRGPQGPQGPQGPAGA